MVQENTSDDESLVEERTKIKKKKNKDKKRKREEEDAQREKEIRRASRKKKREEKRQHKQDILAKIPTVDENGIKYTKIQIKRMLKRVKRGLHPVPTEEEERERLRNEAQLRREDEAEFAGLVYQKGDENDSSEGDDNDDANIEGEGRQMDTESRQENEDSPKDTTMDGELPTNNRKKAKRSKPVPPDYVCQACNNTIHPIHWIYDCPKKVTVRGTNQKKKKLRGINEPDSRKLFVSGLPFDVKPSDVNDLFKSCGRIVNCKLIKFGDTGRCNGQAYISFDTDEAASQALKLSGTMIDNGSDDKPKKQGKKSSEAPTRRQLKLKVSKAVNRRATSMKSRRGRN